MIFFGISLIGAGSFFDEVSSSIGKRRMAPDAGSLYAIGFLNALVAAMFFGAGFLFTDHGWEIAAGGTGLLLLRAALEIVQAHATLHAIRITERSTFGLIRVLTIPLLLLSDAWLGYALTVSQIAGIAMIVGAMLLLTLDLKRDGRGVLLTLFTAVNAAITIALFKYDIGHYHTVEAAQAVTVAVTALSFVPGLLRHGGFRALRDQDTVAQSASYGVASLFNSYAYLFGAASVLTAANRAFSVLWASVSGSLAFHEHETGKKMLALAGAIVGVVLMAT